MEGFAQVDSILPVPAQTFDLPILTMKLYGVLVLMATLLTVAGLRCYVCGPNIPCKPETCPDNADSCVTVMGNGFTTKGCTLSTACSALVDCCSGDLCNGAITTGSSVLLMLVTSAIFTVFL